MEDQRRYYTEKEVCMMFKISHNTCRKYYASAVIRIGRCVRYDLGQIEKILQAQRMSDKCPTEL